MPKTQDGQKPPEILAWQFTLHDPKTGKDHLLSLFELLIMRDMWKMASSNADARHATVGFQRAWDYFVKARRTGNPSQV